MLSTLVGLLEKELKNPLPGIQAHNIMLPVVRQDGYLKNVDENQKPKSGGVLILLYKGQDGQIKFPLMLRTEYDGVHSGQVSFPGGKMEDTDKDIFYTALRESEEELGIVPEQVQILGSLSEVFVIVSNFIIHPVLAYSESIPDYKPDPKEVQVVIETGLEDIISEHKRKYGELMVRGKYRIETPYFDIQDRVVWGATAMILSELSELVKRTGFKL